MEAMRMSLGTIPPKIVDLVRNTTDATTKAALLRTTDEDIRMLVVATKGAFARRICVSEVTSMTDEAYEEYFAKMQREMLERYTKEARLVRNLLDMVRQGKTQEGELAHMNLIIDDSTLSPVTRELEAEADMVVDTDEELARRMQIIAETLRERQAAALAGAQAPEPKLAAEKDVSPKGSNQQDADVDMGGQFNFPKAAASSSASSGSTGLTTVQGRGRGRGKGLTANAHVAGGRSIAVHARG
jgi:hypothetical protein